MSSPPAESRLLGGSAKLARAGAGCTTRGSDAPVVGVLISGRGSNLQALMDAVAGGGLRARIGLVISNKPSAPGLERAAAAGIETLVLDHRAASSRNEYDRRLASELKDRRVEVICLAGFMRLVGAPLLDAYPSRILNVHPSLLPAFPGVDAQRQALEHGVKVSGATVHLVTGELDGGPIILQGAVPVQDDDTVETLSARILVEEHRLFPLAVQMILDGRWRVEGRRFFSESAPEGGSSAPRAAPWGAA